MATYLLMRLYGPLASWGEIAVGEARHSSVQPSKSALLGLLGAALGIEREDDAAQSALAEGYRFAVKLVAVGMPLRDYHTVQVGVPGRKEQFRTRRQSLAGRRTNTILSARDYRCDSIAVVAIEALPGAPYTLLHLADALRQPHFVPYLGRKACPLALPLSPICAEADSVRQALDEAPMLPMIGLTARRVDMTWPGDGDRRAFGRGAPRYYWEEGMQAGMAASFTTVRNDQPISRRRWQFSPRREHVGQAGDR